MADQPGNDEDAVHEAAPQGADDAVPPAAAPEPDGVELSDDQLGKVAGGTGKVPDIHKGVIQNIRG